MKYKGIAGSGGANDGRRKLAINVEKENAVQFIFLVLPEIQDKAAKEYSTMIKRLFTVETWSAELLNRIPFATCCKRECSGISSDVPWSHIYLANSRTGLA